MAGGVNRVILLGNLGRDPEIRFTNSGQAVCNFSVATNESWTDKDGQKKERTEWHKVVVWGKLGELCGEYLKKGRQVFIEGKLQTREWTDKENKKNYTTEIVAQNVQFIGAREGMGGSRGNGQEYGPPPPGMDEMGPGPGAPPPSGGGSDEDIPF